MGESAKEGDMVVNVEKTKNLGNQRSSTADKAIQLTPPITFTLEEALEYIEDDELVEVTPQSIRLRKHILSSVERKKASRVEGSAGLSAGGTIRPLRPWTMKGKWASCATEAPVCSVCKIQPTIANNHVDTSRQR